MSSQYSYLFISKPDAYEKFYRKFDEDYDTAKCSACGHKKKGVNNHEQVGYEFGEYLFDSVNGMFYDGLNRWFKEGGINV